MFIIKILLLVGLIKLLTITNKPFICAGIYAAAEFIFSVASGAVMSHLLISTGLGFALPAGYFWVLDYMDGMGFIWWFVAAIGPGIVLI